MFQSIKNYLLHLSLRQCCAWVALVSTAMFVFGLYLQHVVGLEPCPMCIVQRYALFLVAACAGIAWVLGINAGKNASLRAAEMAPKNSWGTKLFAALAGLFAVFGAFVAARQSWLQWYPPEVASCGRDFYGMVETFPLKRALPMIFRGGGDCSKVDWTFLGGSIANWSFVAFVSLAVVLVWVGLRSK